MWLGLISDNNKLLLQKYEEKTALLQRRSDDAATTKPQGNPKTIFATDPIIFTTHKYTNKYTPGQDEIMQSTSAAPLEGIVDACETRRAFHQTTDCAYWL